MEENDTPIIPFKLKPDANKLKTFFITHLNRIYFAKSHLVQRLPEIENEANFRDLQQAIAATRTIVETQITNMREMYRLLEAEMAVESFKGMKGLVDDAFLAIQQHSADAWLRDMSILFYMQNIESLEIASFQALQIAAVKLKNNEVKQLLQDNFTAAKADRALLLMLSAKYIMG